MGANKSRENVNNRVFYVFQLLFFVLNFNSHFQTSLKKSLKAKLNESNNKTYKHSQYRFLE